MKTTKPKTRVTPFTSSLNPWYVCEYFYDDEWERFTRNYLDGSDSYCWNREQPEIFQNFDDAVNFCKQWDSIEEILDARIRMDGEYDQALKAYKVKLAKAQKTWTSDDE